MRQSNKFYYYILYNQIKAIEANKVKKICFKKKYFVTNENETIYFHEYVKKGNFLRLEAQLDRMLNALNKKFGAEKDGFLLKRDLCIKRENNEILFKNTDFVFYKNEKEILIFLAENVVL